MAKGLARCIVLLVIDKYDVLFQYNVTESFKKERYKRKHFFSNFNFSSLGLRRRVPNIYAKLR